MTDDWRPRLKGAIERSNRSMREVSLAAGRAHGYVNSILNEGKDPTITNLEAVCRVLGVSMIEILFGIPLTLNEQELIELLSKASAAKQQSVRVLLSPDNEP